MSIAKEDLSVSTSTTGGFATEQAARLLRRLALQIVRTTKSHGAAEVHDLRVAIRRFMCVLVVLKPCFRPKESRRIRRRLKEIMVQAGSVRDCDIALRLVAKLAPSSGPLVRQLRTEREEATRALAASLRCWVRRNLTAKWWVALEGEGGAQEFSANAVKVTARRIMPWMAKEYFRCGKDAARDQAPAEELHRFRIAAKNFRYALDLFAPLYGASANGLIQQLKDIQTLLGEVNDCATVGRMVSRHKGGREILAALKKRQRKKAEEFRQHWTAAFSSAAAVRRWTDNLRHVGDQPRVARKPPARSARAALVTKRPATA
ncbi:MAG: CHAD domain-containing protein [Bryobacteraceae bacterium]